MFWVVYSKLKKLLNSIYPTGIDVENQKKLYDYLADGDNFYSISSMNAFSLTNVWVYTLMYVPRWSAGELWINNENMSNLACSLNNNTNYGELVKSIVSEPTFMTRVELKNSGNFYCFIIYKPQMG